MLSKSASSTRTLYNRGQVRPILSVAYPILRWTLAIFGSDSAGIAAATCRAGDTAIVDRAIRDARKVTLERCPLKNEVGVKAGVQV